MLAPGKALGDAVRVNDGRPPKGFSDPQLAMAADGGLAALWKEQVLAAELDLPSGCFSGCLTNDLEASRLNLRRYGSDGSASAIQTVDSTLLLGSGLLSLAGAVGLAIASEIGDYRLAMANDGRVSVVWHKSTAALLLTTSLSSYSLQLLRYEVDGRAHLAQRLPSLDCGGPYDVGMDDGGGLIVLYESDAACCSPAAVLFDA